jgi:hypothetical protein
MTTRPDKPIESYPVVAEADRPTLPPADAPPPAGETTAAPADKPLPFERLSFVAGKSVEEVVPLDFPFKWQGRTVASVTVRRLAAFEVAQVAESEEFASAGMWAIYGTQSGLPAGVIRGMMEDDCDRVVEVNRRFLPRAFRETLNRLDAAASPSSATPESGAPTPPA